MDVSNLPKQKSAETNTDGRPKNLPGIYVHRDTRATYITAPGEEGTIQADALMSPLWEHAWEWTAEVPTRLEIQAMQEAQLKKDTALIDGKKAEPTPEPVATLPPGGETFTPTTN